MTEKKDESGNMVEIPEPLHQDEFRFIKIQEESKRPFENNWQEDSNYRHNVEELQEHLANGGNYGVVGGYGDLVIIDCDQENVENAVAANLPETLKIRTGGGGAHYYFICPDLDDPIRLKDTEAGDLGDVQSSGKQVVGPTSVHPSGGIYSIEEENTIAEVSAEEIKYALRKFMMKKQVDKTKEQQAINKAYDQKDVDINITQVVDIVSLERRGNEFHGAHPVHGSSTGINFWVNTVKNTWHCFRHDSGGGPLSWIAVKEGIISCGDAVPGGLRGHDFEEAIEVGREKYGLPDPVEEYESEESKTWESLIALYEDSNTSKVAALKKTANFLRDKYDFVTFEDSEKMWVFTNPTYQQKGEKMVEKKLECNLQKYLRTRDINEVRDSIKRRTYTERSDVSKHEKYIPLKNGWYNIETGELEEPDPQLFVTGEIPVTYDPDAKCPQIMEFIKDIVEEENIPVLQEMVGYCLYRDYPIARAFMLLGDGENGKSTFLELLEGFLGQKNIANPSLQKLLYDRFAKIDLKNKLANIHADLEPDRLERAGTFKMLTGDDTVEGEYKHVQDKVEFRNHAKLIYSANELPPTDEISDAFFRRWEIIEFPFKFTSDPDDGHKDKDASLPERIMTDQELSGMLNWAIEGLERVLEQDSFTETGRMEEIKQKWLTQTNPLRVFVEEYTEVDHNSFLTKDEFYSAYQEFCKAHAAPVADKNVVGRKIPKLLSEVDSFKPKVDGSQQRSWKNIKFKDDITRITDVEIYTRPREENNNDSNTNKKQSITPDTRDTEDKDLNTDAAGTRQKMLNYIEDTDKGDGVLISDIISYMDLADEMIEDVIGRLLKDGTLFQPGGKKGRVKKVK